MKDNKDRKKRNYERIIKHARRRRRSRGMLRNDTYSTRLYF